MSDKKEAVGCAKCPARANSCFSGLSESECALIDEVRTLVRFESGHDLPLSLVEAGSPSGFFCLREGQVAYRVEGTRKGMNTVRICGPGDLVGYCALEPGCSGRHTIRTLRSGSACYFDREAFAKIQKQSTAVSTSLIQMLCRIVGIKEERIAALENHSVKNRVAAALLSLNSKFGVPSEFGSMIDLEVDRKTLAELSGTVVETFSRILTELAEEKLIVRQGRRIHIVDVSGLSRIVNS